MDYAIKERRENQICRDKKNKIDKNNQALLFELQVVK